MRVLYFDLDDTIYDRGVPFERAFAAFFDREDNALARRAYQTCSVRSNEVFEDSQMGRITMEEMYIYRYQRGFADVGITLSNEEALEYQYTYAQMQKQLEITPQMAKILEFCKQSFDKVGIITNGPGAHQREKLHALGLEPWLTEGMVIVSGDYQIVKPDPRIFRIAERAADTPKAEYIYVGDSYDTDIAPAAALGWKTIWLNRKGKPIPQGGAAPTLTVRNEDELLAALKAI